MEPEKQRLDLQRRLNPRRDGGSPGHKDSLSFIHPSCLKSPFEKSQVLSLSHNQLRCLRPLSVLVSLSEVGIEAKKGPRSCTTGAQCTLKNGSLEDHVFFFALTKDFPCSLCL